MKKVEVGVIGVGYLGRFHAEKYANMPDVHLAGVVDTDAGRAGQIAAQLNTRAFTDPAGLIGSVEAVSIVVPTLLHHDVAGHFLNQGIHVLIEKPITATIAQADDLIDRAERNGLVLQVGHIERFNPAFTAVKTLLKSPRYITAERAAPFTLRCTDVNVILDLMIHDLDLVSDLAGAVPKGLCAAGASVITGDIDMATARILFHNGCIADVSASRISDEKKRQLRVVDDEIIYLSDLQNQQASTRQKGAGPDLKMITHSLNVEKRDTLGEEVRAFVQSIRSNGRPLVSGVEGRRALALALTITDAIEQGITGFVPVS